MGSPMSLGRSSRRPVPRLVALAFALPVALAAAPVSAQWGVATSLYTQDGVEVAVDARLFSVFAMLNGLGYDREEEVGPPPLFRPRFSEGRAQARSRLGRPGPSLQAMAKVVEQFREDPSAYARAALHLGAAPRFDAAKTAPELARALVTPLKGWYNEEGGAASFRAVAASMADKQKRLLEPLDALCRKLAVDVRLGTEEDQLLDDTGAEGRVVVMLNELDTHGTLVREQVGDITYILTGPRRTADDDAPVLHAAGLAFARTLVSGEIAKHEKQGTLADTRALLTGEAKAKLPDTKAYLSELLACGLLLRASPGATCAGSPLEGEQALAPVLAAIDARLAAYLEDTRLFPEALPELIAPLAPTADASRAPPAVPAQP